MKLHSLKMKGFGPFASAARIDFQPFQAVPILLIHGRTGAGKTSVLDAITYALYGRASGMDGRTPDTLRSRMIGEDEETEVELIFQLRDDRYRATRCPEYIRKKKRGEGFIKENPSALLERWETDHWSPIATKVYEVNDKVESLLGFSYDQFTQVLILPQGKFRQMLIADSMQRRDIFRQLFKTGDLEAMQDRMRKDASLMRKQIEEKDIRISELYSLLQGDGGDVIDSVEGAEGILQGLAGDIRSLDQDLVGHRASLKEIGSQRDRVLKTIQTRKSLDDWKERVHKLLAKEADMEILKGRLARGERAQAIHGQREDLDRLVTQRNADESHLQTLYRQKDRTEKKLEDLPEEEAVEAVLQWVRDFERFIDERNEINRKLVVIRRNIRTNENRTIKNKEAGLVLEKERENLKIQLKEIQDLNRREMAFVLARDLEEGSPCPVCGSIHHPQLAQPAPAAMRMEETVAQALSKAEMEWENNRRQAHDLETLKAGFTGEEKAAVAQLNALPEMEEVSAREYRKRMRHAHKDRAAIKEAREGLASLKGQIAMVEQGWTQKKEEVRICRMQWKETLEKSGFHSNKAYEEAVCSYEDLQKMSRSLQQYLLDLAEAKRQVAALALDLDRQAVDGDLDLEVLDQKIREWTDLIDEKTRMLTVKTSRMKGYEKSLTRLKKEVKAKADLEEAFGSLAWMADVASGRNRLGMDFEQFVLRRYLAEVLAVANERLAILTDGRYELTMQDERRDKRKRFGLDLDVFDYYAGDKRPVGSLSGGESFKASLALALGLSDVVRTFAGGIELETLFIDEGFGTLDPASLDQAVEVLVELKQQNRMVGIISHVPELKERIDNRIEVVKNKGKQGSRIQIHLPGGGTYETMSLSGR
jgi:exonuclease SbcC